MITSPLRYPGGKAKLFPYFSELIKANNLFGSHYKEPYAGGAGLAIRLLTGGFVDKLTINDIDQSIYAFWISVLFNTDRFCRKIERTPVNIKEWERQKKIWTVSDVTDPLALGFAAYFLNRTNRSGIIEGAGPIGGYAQNGDWKIDVRLVKEKQIDNIRILSQFAKQIVVTNFDACQFLVSAWDKDSFVYLDPPYFVKGHKLYKNYYTPKDHQTIAKLLARKRRSRWIVSYDDAPQIREAYASFTRISYSLNYSAGPKTMGTEVIFLSESLEAPEVRGFKASRGKPIGSRLQSLR